MKPKSTRVFKCFKCSVYFYLCLICISGLCLATFTTYLLIFRPENHVYKPRLIIISFLILPTVLTIISAVLGCMAVKKKSTKLLKFFAVCLAITDILQIAGCLWCFISLPDINDEVSSYVEEKFVTMASNTTDTFYDKWWNNIQEKLKCCGLYGPTDYATVKAVPLSCCGSDEQRGSASCSMIWQKGCSSALTKEVSQDLLLLGLIGLGVTFIQAPGIFIAWCFARRISKEGL